MLLTNFAALYNKRELLLAWIMRTIRARYQQSLLGGLWAIGQPAATVAIFSIVFTRFVPIDTGGPPYVIFSFTAVVPWTFFAAGIVDMVTSLVANMNLVTKIYFPREILPMAALFARGLDFLIGITVLLILLIFYRQPLFLLGLLYLPVIILIQLALALGLGFIGAALNVFYRDIQYLISLIIQIWFYASPIIYPVTRVPESIQPFYFLNPMAGVLEAYRAVLLYERLPGPYLWLSAAVSLTVLAFGYWFFKRVEFQFADVV
jgi:lipopolysaccharide transport system permease protein